ncbi:hypothetical protein D3C77_444370 [compost metagenome]
MQVAVGLGDVDALVDRGDVSRAGERPDDAAGAQDRQTTEDTQARVHGFQRQVLAVLHVHRDFKAAAVAALTGQALQVFGHHPSRHRIDRRLAHRQYQAGTGHGTDTLARHKAHAGLGLQAYAAIEQGAVGDVRIVAGILEGAGLGALFEQAAELQAHLHLLAFRQGDVDRVVLLARQQQPRRRKAGGGGTAAGGQAAAQWGGLFLGFVTHRGA